jgi:hypothetical protein
MSAVDAWGLVGACLAGFLVAAVAYVFGYSRGYARGQEEARASSAKVFADLERRTNDIIAGAKAESAIRVAEFRRFVTGVAKRCPRCQERAGRAGGIPS